MFHQLLKFCHFRRLKVGLPCNGNQIFAKDWWIYTPTVLAIRQRHSSCNDWWCAERVCYQRGHLVYDRNMCIIHRDCCRYVSPCMFVVAKPDIPAGSGFTLTSSKGKCAVLNNVLTCASTVSTATVFTVCSAPVFVFHEFDP